MFCAFWGPKLNPLGAKWGQEAVQGGGSGASWGLPAPRPVGLQVRPRSWEPVGTEPMGIWALGGVEHSTVLSKKRLRRVKDNGAKLRAGGSRDAVDFVSGFGWESQRVWELQVGGCSLHVVQGRSYMKGGINRECGCSAGPGKPFGARLHPFHQSSSTSLNKGIWDQ